MTKDIRAIAAACLILGTLSFGWILYDLFLIVTDLEGVLFGAKGAIVFFGYLVILLLHGAAFILILMLFSRLREFAALKSGSMAALTLSLFMIAVQKVMYDEVGREIKFGLENAQEIAFIYLGLVINALFCLLAIGLAALVFRRFDTGTVLDEGEPIFTLAQYMGIVSGFLGLMLTFSLMGIQIPVGKLWVYVPFFLLFLVPYGLTAMFWVILKRKESVEDWYDEKQWQDLARAALATLILSLPALTVFLLVADAVGLYWYPFYLFMVLFFFSGSTLYFYKRT